MSSPLLERIRIATIAGPDLAAIESLYSTWLDQTVREDEDCVSMVFEAIQYHELSYEDKLKYWKHRKKPSRWPKLMAAISYADKMIEAFDFEELKW